MTPRKSVKKETKAKWNQLRRTEMRLYTDAIELQEGRIADILAWPDDATEILDHAPNQHGDGYGGEGDGAGNEHLPVAVGAFFGFEGGGEAGGVALDR